MNKTKTLPKRNEVPDQFKWKLEDIYATNSDWEKDAELAKTLIQKAQSFKGKLADSGKQLLEALTLMDELSQVIEKIYVYARMRRDEDNGNSTYQALTDRATSLSTQVSSALAYIQPEILAIEDDRLEALLNEESGLDHYRRFLEDEIIRYKPHTLSAEEEVLLAEMREISGAPANIFTMLNNADIKFPMVTDENGEEVELTKGRYSQYMESKDRRLRHDAFKAMYETYRNHKNTIAATLIASVKRDVFYARTRKHSSALQASLFNDNVDQSVYDNLIATIHTNLPELQRYLDLRKKMLDVDELHMYDLYVPIVAEANMKIPYEEAVKTVEDSLAPLGEAYGKVLHEGFTSGWVDVYENQGKTSGAYSWGTYSVHPYVLMNYQDNLNNMFTLAHEMGHALHSYYSHEKQPYTYSQYQIFVAEVASTLNEALLMQHMLAQTTEKEKRMYLLNYYLEQFRATVFRQTMFAEFEKMIHATIEEGQALTVDSLSSMYRELNVKYFGDSVVIDEDIDLEWARIPHFYNNFYVYKYATGFSAATSLSKQILEEGEPAVERYLNFLASGGSDYPIELLKKAGVDMAKPEPIEEAMAVFKGLLDELEQLVLSK
ncbi:oligoendopeptidase F [Brevibacillus laterosporus]|nr:oligoendopeptidase F [Brevibacillus laterosporus]TPG67826.1 oligoendopeptidase F [Brevibacillus laterosporus]TPG89480.1 oligoendopeptidase F [Brevibacillus laterosporus]